MLNFSLLFNKWIVRLNTHEWDKIKNRNNRNFPFRVFKGNPLYNTDGRKKAILLRSSIEIYKKFHKKELITNIVLSYIENLKTAGFKPLELEAQTRLVIGIGLPSFFENGITLHHIYGIPYIPSSSVKGLLRFTYFVGALNIFPVGVNDLPKAFEWKNEDLEPKEVFKVLTQLDQLITNSKSFKDFKENLERRISKNEERNPLRFLEIKDPQELENFYKTFVELFGTLHQKGKVIFADALAEEFKFVVDIMNPHYKEYYQSSEKNRKSDNAPYLIADIYTPTPIPFLALERGSKFVFLYKGNGNKKLIENLLKEGLNLFGIGGKKRKGYGFLNLKQIQ